MLHNIRYKKAIIVTALVIVLLVIYYWFCVKATKIEDKSADKLEDKPAAKELSSADLLPKEEKDGGDFGGDIISLKDVENYSLVTDGNISLSFDEDDTYIVE